MIMFEYPMAILALLPVILIECWVVRREVGLSISKNLKAVALANLASTLVGFPLAWLLRFSLELSVLVVVTTLKISRGPSFAQNPLAEWIGVILGSAWLVPNDEGLWWTIPIAALIGLVPAFFISVEIERKIVAKYWTEFSEKIPKTVFRANLASYFFLTLMLLGLLGYGYVNRDPLKRLARADGATLRRGGDVAWLRISSPDKLGRLADDFLSVDRFSTIDLNGVKLHNVNLSELKKLDRTSSLGFSRCSLEDADLKKLPSMTHVESLDLSGNSILDEGFSALVGWTALRRLQLYSSRVTDRAFLGISKVAQLTELDLSNNEITGSDLAKLGVLKNLQSLDLSRNPITKSGALHLNELKFLETLNLGDTPVNDEGLAGIRYLLNLKRLHLWRTRVTDAGLVYVSGLYNLENLSIDLPGVTDEGLRHLEGLSKLEVLDLNNAKIQGPGLRHLYGLSHLKRLWLVRTGVSEADVAALRKALPRTEVFLK